jgi:RNA polymerase sigma-70 factor, ECF subfamily
MNPNEQFLKLFLRHQGDLRAFLISVVRDRTHAEDLFQEAALTLWQSFAQYDPSRPFGAWARGIAMKKVLQAREKARRIPLAFSPQAIQAVLEAYDRMESRGPDLDRLRECIQKLPERSRRVLELRYEQSLKLGEIARRSGGTLDAVHKLLCRVREALQTCLERRIQSQRS